MKEITGTITELFEKPNSKGNMMHYLEVTEQDGKKAIYSDFGNMPDNLIGGEKIRLWFEESGQYRNKKKYEILAASSAKNDAKPTLTFDITKAIDNLEQLLAYLKEQMK
jgi:hypothetical protein